MALANAARALDPVWLRFTDPDDISIYGERWYRYDEGSFLRRPARALIELETELGMPIVSVMNGFRSNSVLGDTAVAWLAVRETDMDVAGDFDEFNPITMMIEWSRSDPEPGKDVPPDFMPDPVDSSLPIPDPSPNTTSAPRDSVALPILPPAGSGLS